MDEHGDDRIDEAWDAFRGRLADRLAAFEDDEVLVVEVQVGVDDDDLAGAAPYVQFCGWGGDLIRAEVAGNHHLDERFHLDEDQQERLALDWCEPDGETPHFHQDAERRGADLLAAEVVAALREVHGVPHPAFLDAEGLQVDPDDQPVEPAVVQVAADPDAATLPRNHEELQALVDAAMAEVVEELTHDSDGDVPVRSGLSVVFVRVLPDRPAVEVFAELVTHPSDLARLPVELDILNRSHPMARFSMADSAVRMSYVMAAWPFVPRQLHLVVRHFIDDVDDIARDLATRVGGRRFMQEPEPEHAPTPERHEALTGLLELLELGPVSSPVVAHLFGYDRSLVIAHLVGLRTGRIDCGDTDQERVLTCLRRGLRLIVDGEVPERRPRRLPPRPRTEQTSLLTDDDAGEDTLDLGHSA